MKKVYIFWVGFVSLVSYYFLSFLHYDSQILSDELILMVNFMIISSICVLKCITFIFYVFIFVLGVCPRLIGFKRVRVFHLISVREEHQSTIGMKRGFREKQDVEMICL